jgi:hypothetical protein
MTIERVLAGLVLLTVLGCGEPPATTNPKLKVPDVPPGGRDSKGDLKELRPKK